TNGEFDTRAKASRKDADAGAAGDSAVRGGDGLVAGDLEREGEGVAARVAELEAVGDGSEGNVAAGDLHGAGVAAVHLVGGVKGTDCQREGRPDGRTVGRTEREVRGGVGLPKEHAGRPTAVVSSDEVRQAVAVDVCHCHGVRSVTGGEV